MRIGKVLIFLHFTAVSLAFCLAGARGAESPFFQIDRPYGELGFIYEDHETNTDSLFSHTNSEGKFFFQELKLGTKISLYDPRLIELTLEGGLLIGQGQTDIHTNLSGTESSTSENFDLSVTSYRIHANILKMHAVSGDATFGKSESEAEHTPASLTTVKRTESSVGLRFKEKLGIPIPIRLNYSEVEQESDNIFEFRDVPGFVGRFQRFKEISKKFTIISIKKWETVDLSWEYASEDINEIREVDLDVSAVQFNESAFNLDTSGRAGDDDRYRWRVGFSQVSRSDFPKTERKDTQEELRIKLYEAFASSLDMVLGVGATRTERESGASAASTTPATENVDNDRWLFGFDHRLFRSLFSELKLRSDETSYSASNSARKISEILLGTRYTKLIPDGNVNASYSISQTEEINTGAQTLSVVNEIQALIDFSPTQLNSENIDLATVVVTDLSEVIVYQEGVDYRIFQTGVNTFIERLPGTNILNGEQVLIDYSYSAPRGDIERKIQTYTLGTRWRFMEPYIRVSKREETLLEGPVETLELLNSGKSTIYGLVLRHTFWNIVTPEFKTEQEDNTLRRDPFDRQSQSASVAVLIGFGMTTTVFFSKTEIDFLTSDNDTENTNNGVNFAYKRGRITATLGISNESSSIGSSEREVATQRAGFAITYGKWTLDSAVRFADESSADAAIPGSRFEGDNFDFRLGLKRVF